MVNMYTTVYIRSENRASCRQNKKIPLPRFGEGIDENQLSLPFDGAIYIRIV